MGGEWEDNWRGRKKEMGRKSSDLDFKRRKEKKFDNDPEPALWTHYDKTNY